jgi:hypothetical protein
VDRVWIVNVDGQRLVVDANYLPTATSAERAELGRVVHSIRFLRTGPTVRNGDWIAYATAPARGRYRGGLVGSDVFIVRPGGQPTLVAGRGSEKLWNLCPAFSPNGAMLAFARVKERQSIVVVGVTHGGRIGTAKAVFPVQRVPGSPRCPKWSADSSRLAYLDGGGHLVVRGLDGSRLQQADGDPTIRDFGRSTPELPSPAGDLVANRSADGIVVSNPKGGDRRVIEDSPPSYAIAGWSPDSRQLLVMRDVGGGFTMRAVSVDAPFASTTIATYVVVNNARSWPGYGDVSWQPKPQPAVALSAAAASARSGTWPTCRAADGLLSVAQLMEARRAGDVRANLWPHICGPTKVVAGKSYSFTVVVTNIGDSPYRGLELAVSHYRPFARASLPYRREPASNGDPHMRGAVWTISDLEPGRSFRVSFALPFTRHPDPRASNFEVDAFLPGGSVHSANLLGNVHDVVFVRTG